MRNFLLIAGIHLLAVMSPGLNLALVIRNSLVYVRRTGVWVALGFALGDAVHIAYSLVGLGLLLVHSSLAFTTLKWVGAAYLVYLGIKALLAKPPALSSPLGTAAAPPLEPHRQLAPLKALRLGFLTDLLNPKASLFFLALFTQVIQPTTSLPLKLLYSAEMITATFTWFTLVALLLTRKRLQRAVGRHQHRVDRVFGVVLILFGISAVVH